MWDKMTSKARGADDPQPCGELQSLQPQRFLTLCCARVEYGMQQTFVGLHLDMCAQDCTRIRLQLSFSLSLSQLFLNRHIDSTKKKGTLKRYAHIYATFTQYSNLDMFETIFGNATVFSSCFQEGQRHFGYVSTTA